MYLNSVREEDLVFGMLGDFGALVRHAAVGKLQRFLNDHANSAGYGALEEDRKYGGCTHATMKRFAAWYASQPNVTLVYSASQIDMGPMMYIQFLNVPPYQGFSAAEMVELQAAFQEWDSAGRPACGEGPIPGTSPDGDGILPDPGTPGDGGTTVTGEIAPLTQKAGMGVLGWFLVVLAVGGVGYGIYRYSKQPKALPRRNVRSHVNRWAA